MSRRTTALLLAAVAAVDVTLGVWVHARWWAMLPGVAPLAAYLLAWATLRRHVRWARRYRDDWLTGFAAATAREVRRQVPRGPGVAIMSTRMADGIVPPSASLYPRAGALRRSIDVDHPHSARGKPQADTSWVAMTDGWQNRIADLDQQLARLASVPPARLNPPTKVTVSYATGGRWSIRTPDAVVDLPPGTTSKQAFAWRDALAASAADGVPARYPFTDADRMWIRRHMALAREGRVTS